MIQPIKVGQSKKNLTSLIDRYRLTIYSLHTDIEPVHKILSSSVLLTFLKYNKKFVPFLFCNLLSLYLLWNPNKKNCKYNTNYVTCHEEKHPLLCVSHFTDFVLWQLKSTIFFVKVNFTYEFLCAHLRYL